MDSLQDPLSILFLRFSWNKLKAILIFRTSLIPGAGLGVFANMPFQAKTIVGYYNGVHLVKNEVKRL
jgi:hypothetical protein